ncbi:hypothetical protein [Alistipes onderdonkii]|uniref:hypothetical protein n=1 Tax=Alistipes onderdonkii TaxID=328813 RepID=UPI0032198027
MSDIVQFDVSTMELTINGDRYIGMYSSDVNNLDSRLKDIYSKVFTAFYLKNTETLEERNLILSTIKMIIDRDYLSYLDKMKLISNLTGHNKDLLDDFESMKKD